MSSAQQSGSLLRRIGAPVLGVLAVLALLVTVVATPVRALVTSTDTYLAVVGPVVDDADLRVAVSEAVAERAVAAVPDGALTQWLPDAVGERAGSLGRSVLIGLVRDTVQRLLASDAAAGLWRGANRVVHQQASATLRGADDALVGVRESDGEAVLTLDLTRVWDRARAELGDLGLPAVLLPERAVVVDVTEGSSLVRARGATSVVLALPFVAGGVALLAGVGAVLLARRHVRAVGVLAGGVVLGAGVGILAVALLAPRAEGVMSTRVGELLVAGLVQRGARLVLDGLWWTVLIALVVVLVVVLRPRVTALRQRRRATPS